VVRQTIVTLVLLLTGGAAVHVQSPSTTLATPKETRELNLTAYAELLRSDLRTQKVAIITEVVGFTEAEDKAFWPVYRQFDAEMAKLGDERVALISDYSKNYANLTDEAADRIARGALDVQGKRQALVAKYYDQIAKVIPPRTALRAWQVEIQLELLIDLQIASALPIAK
jgi:hypothetical protein